MAHCYCNTLFSNATHKRILVLSLQKDHMTMYYISHSTYWIHCTVLFYSAFDKGPAKIYTRCECRKVLFFCPTVSDPFSVFVEKEVRNKSIDRILCFSWNFSMAAARGVRCTQNTMGTVPSFIGHFLRCCRLLLISWPQKRVWACYRSSLI